MKKLIVVFLILPLLQACGSSTENPRSAAALDSAAAAGRRDAAIFSDRKATDMDREGALLLVRHKEAHMRALGYDEAADAYISGAEEFKPESIRQ
ncbi:MAG: hypothetical protein K2M12_00095 [Muribaculaceae bacterium]|nr:hypothetical protein [Muribaculaceae bacterium]